ncbi:MULTISPECIES: substrate-binding periplasmic protein [Sphingobium]|jgi:ABC-type amino acid transport substrate-binding protein|uniref:Amino acid ABC transporter substrate-binding protein n=1 Tax=Sphingobium fuliginis (strain ATCC 27551) TaxID=336203 RepID=A0A292ZLX1_SPHSA|nr:MULTISPECIES: transporter substrate-binding domain-containing protein [Sphingobium]AJR23741.1 ABC transporter substrate-binding protein [Sphingobium sp. YBL2]MCB4862861.1 transporter substrate-binding domain-containing protein [Sphingobium sp. PNB]QOT73725.1 transporter substrate-binding domain-containing protein [Sphingobium fuliginis]RYL96971.1 transporter substrate-binding domain-containing protein [Sphingobium fuliginis]UXC93192.1 transporter substrate-binding domain-containing protein 
MLSRRGLIGGAGAAMALGLCPGMTHAAPLGKVKELGVLRVVVYKDNRPWSWEEGGKLVGLDADLASAIAGKLGVRADLAQLVADESADDDLRHGVWKGGLLGFAPGDLMLHVPFDRTFAARNDQVAIIAPYYRESFRFAGTQNAIDLEAPPTGWRGHRLAAELDSIPDFYLIGSFGGILAKDVAHYPSGSDAVAAVAAGKADAVLASRAQIEEGLHRGAKGLTLRKGPLPAFTSPGWDIGMAVKENSRTLGDAVEEIVAAMAASGEMKALFATYGVQWTPALAAG